MKFSSLIILLVCFNVLSIDAQELISGQVFTDDSIMVAGAEVFIDNYEICCTNGSGVFILQREDTTFVFRPKKIMLNKAGYMLKSWSYGDKMLRIIVEPTIKVVGKVESAEKIPIPEMNIMMVGHPGVKPATTNAEGKFTLEVPRSIPIDANTMMVAYDSEKYRSKINYEMTINQNNFVNFKVEFIPRLVKLVKIIDENNKPVPTVEIFIDGIRYLSNVYGELHPRHFITDISGFKLKDYMISSLEYDYSRSDMRVKIRPPKEGEEIRQVEINALEDRFIRNQ